MNTGEPRLTRTPRYLEPRISRTPPRHLELCPISLGFIYCFSVIYYWLSRTLLSRRACYLKVTLAPVA